MSKIYKDNDYIIICDKTEVLCSYSTSKYLEKLGFNLKCRYMSSNFSENIVEFMSFDENKFSKLLNPVLIPTIDCAAKWLREVKHEQIQLIYSKVKDE